MIQFRFKLTWPLAVLIFVAVAAWLLRHASQAQAHPATPPIDPRRVIFADAPAEPGHEDTFDRIYREAAEAGRVAYDEPTEFTDAANRLRSKRYANRYEDRRSKHHPANSRSADDRADQPRECRR